MKYFLSLILCLLLTSVAYAYDGGGGAAPTYGATSALSITSNVATQTRCRAVWIGTTESFDFSFDGSTWVTFQGSTAGTVVPIQVVGARVTSGTASPSAGDIVFLY